MPSYQQSQRGRQYLPRTFNIPEFADFVLGLDLFNLQASMAEPCTPVSVISESKEMYYDQYLPLIRQEALGILQAAMNKRSSVKAYVVRLQAQDNWRYYDDENVTAIAIDESDELANLAKNLGAYRFIVVQATVDQVLTVGIVDVFMKGVRVVLQGNHESALNRKGWFSVKPLNSFINLDRMYSACVQQRQPPFLSNILTATASPWPERDPGADECKVSDAAGLNDSQQAALEGFVNAPDGLYLLQGPPGTGKTTTVVAILEELLLRSLHERVLVCAASNKAVQVLASRMLQKLPNAVICMAAVEDRISDPQLLSIFLDHWVDRNRKQVNTWRQLLEVQTLFARDDQQRVIVDRSRGVVDHQRLQRWIQAVKAAGVALCDSIPLLLRYTDPAAIPEEDPEASPEERLAGLVQQYRQESRNLTAVVNELLEEGIASRNDAAQPRAHSHVGAATGSDVYERFNARLPALQEALGQLQRLLVYVLELMPSSDEQIFGRSRILFCTLTTSGRPLLQAMARGQPPFTTLIVDEAGQSVEAETLIPLALAPDASKCLLVGDTRQLPATTIADSSKVTRFEWSMMWRLFEENGQEGLRLTTQYRMRAHIRHFPSQRYYAGALHDHPSIADRERALMAHIAPHGLKTWINVQGYERFDNVSYSNHEEAQAILKCVAAIRSVDPNCTIGVICFYAGQVRLVKSLFANRPDLQLKLTVSTVDGFQGDERDVMLISCVRANQGGNSGFLKDFRRINVAITRARDALVLIGDATTFQKAGGEMREILDYCRKFHNGKTDTLESFQNRFRTAYVPVGTAPQALPRVQALRDARQVYPAAHAPRTSRPQSSPAAFQYSFDELLGRVQRLVAAREFRQAKSGCDELLQKTLPQAQAGQVYHILAQIHRANGDSRADEAQAIGDRMLAPGASEIRATPNSIDPLPADAAQTPERPAEDAHLWNEVRKKRQTVASRLDRARALSNEAQYKAAEELYVQLLDEHPYDAEILCGYGWCLNKQKKHVQAILQFERSIGVAETVLAYLGLIVGYRSSGDLSKALNAAYRAEDAFSWSLKIREIRQQLESMSGRRQFATARPAGAAGAAGVAVGNGSRAVVGVGGRAPGSAATAAPTGIASRAAGGAAPATSAAKGGAWCATVGTAGGPADHAAGTRAVGASGGARVGSYPSLLERRTQEAREACKDEGQGPAVALAMYERLLEEHPDSSEVLLGIGWCLHFLRENEDAVEYFEDSLDLQETMSGFYGLARALRFCQPPYLEDALATCKQCLQLYPNASQKQKVQNLQQEIQELMSRRR